MIKFFRKIRQNLLSEGKTSKYLKYAVGEIILVVIGILIALSINNWNEERKNDLKESHLIKNIMEDLSLDSIQISKSLDELSDQMHVADKLIAKALDNGKILDYNSMGLIRYSSDFSPISRRYHGESVSNLENEFSREILQNYFLLEEEVSDIFKEYEGIIHNKIRPYLSDVGMHNISVLDKEQPNQITYILLHPKILDEQVGNVKFQQLIFERRLKTGSFRKLLEELKIKNQELIKILRINNN